jgi:WD40 repeat protein
MVLLTAGIGTVQAPTGKSPAVLDTAELFDTVNHKFTAAAGKLTTHRDRHTATVLASGQVLVVGGVDTVLVPLILFPGPAMPWIRSSTEIFDPSTARFSVAAPMQSGRDEPTATLLPNGKVLVIGGGTDSAELYDPIARKFSSAGTGSASRYEQTATLLQNGKVLIAGGGAAQADLFDPVTGHFTPTGTMMTNRVYDTATLLPNGKVLIAGGSAYARSPALSTTEIYDPAAGTFTPGPAMTEPRAGHTATLLNDGQVFITGGSSDKLAEIYNQYINSFYPAALMNDSRRGHSATLLPDGQVLIAGGWDETYEPLATAQLYDPASGQFSQPIEMMEARAGQTANLIWIRWPLTTASPTPGINATSTPTPIMH